MSQDVRVLLIDDDEDDYVSIRETLLDIGNAKYDLAWKSSYREGLDELIRQKFDICLLDYRLGQHTGLDLLRDAQLNGSSTPTILLTGQGDFDLDLRAMHLGAADYLVKGQISAPLLERAIRYAIKRALDLKDVEEQKENFQKLFNSTFEGILVHRLGRILDANTAAGDIFKCPSDAMIGANLYKFIRPDFHAEMDHFAAGDERTMEAVGLTSSGQEIYLALSSRKVNLKGHWSSLIAIQDLTLRKQMEAQILQQDRLASLGLLASSLAHEIGTPLGVIRGRAEQVQRNADEKTKSTMSLIVTQIDRISKLVNSLLHIARGQQAEIASDVGLRAVLEDVANLLSHELKQKGITLELSIPELTVRAEPGPLGQVFLNLLVNAIHAIEMAKNRSGHQISIEAAKSGQEVQIKVTDSGCGISERNLSRLFQPFFTTKDIGLGTGLGLATSYKLVHSWGGSISVESKEGRGTTFTVSLKSSQL